MTIEELLAALLEWANGRSEVQSAGKIDGEHTIGVELRDGTEYFVTVEAA